MVFFFSLRAPGTPHGACSWLTAQIFPLCGNKVVAKRELHPSCRAGLRLRVLASPPVRFSGSRLLAWHYCRLLAILSFGVPRRHLSALPLRHGLLNSAEAVIFDCRPRTAVPRLLLVVRLLPSPCRVPVYHRSPTRPPIANRAYTDGDFTRFSSPLPS